MAAFPARPALLILAAFLGCAPPAPPPPRAPPPGPYEVPGAAETAAPAGVFPPVAPDVGPIPVTAADPSRGSPDAPVTIVEFGDLQCSYCGRVVATLAQLQHDYGADQVRVVWKNYPLAFHPAARAAADVAMALHERGGSPLFWRYHDAIFAPRGGFTPALYEAALTATRVPGSEIERIVARGSVAAKIEADKRLGDELGVNGTPAFFINGVHLAGAQPIETFRPIVLDQLDRGKQMVASGVPAARVYAQLTAQNLAAQKQSGATPDEDLKLFRVPVGASPMKGSASAPVTVVLFSDFQSDTCARAATAVDELMARHAGKLRVVWKARPLRFHKRAEPAAELAFEARAQKGDAGFWRVHDLLFAQQGQLEDADLQAVARAAGLDVAAAMRAVAGRRHEAAIEDDADLALDLETYGAPQFFINGRSVADLPPMETLAAIVAEQLAIAQAALDRGVAPAGLYEALQQTAVGTAAFETVSVPPPGNESPSRGPDRAKVVVHVFGDFECPYCQRVEATLKELDDAFPAALRFVWHNHPLPFHPHAELAAEAAMEAFAQKGAAGFWKMHDLLFEHQTGGGLERAAIERYGATVGLNPARLRAALDGSTHSAAIEADAKIAERAGLEGTPAFAINGYKLVGAQPLSKFKRLVRKALAGK